MDTFKLWAFGCPHVGKDMLYGRQSLGDALRDSETDFNDWDMAIGLGDFSGEQGFPTDEEGIETVAQFGMLENHPREAVYTIGGNHDRGPRHNPSAWLRKYVDPMGENTATSGVNPANFPFPVEGTWERYEISVGNLRFLMMSDVIRPNTSLRAMDDRQFGERRYGGDPGGVVSPETYQWWIDKCEQYKDGDEIVITGAHYMLRNTTAYTFDGGRSVPLHGPGLIAEMAAYLAYIGDHPHKYLFREYMEQNPGACAMWLGAHNHLRPTSNDGRGNGMHGNRWGTYFVQCSALTRHHGRRSQLYPKSRVFTFTHGSPIVHKQMYVHEAIWPYPKGLWKNVVEIELPKPVLLA